MLRRFTDRIGLLPWVLAGLVSLVVAWRLWPRPPEALEPVPILAAARDIAPNTMLAATDVMTIAVPRAVTGSVPGLLTDPAAAIGKVAVAPIRRGEPIRAAGLAPRGATAARLGPGERVVALELSVARASGGVVAGDRVDVWRTPDTRLAAGAAQPSVRVASALLVLDARDVKGAAWAAGTGNQIIVSLAVPDAMVGALLDAAQVGVQLVLMGETP